MSDIVRYYSREKNPQGGTFPFQPLCDITEAEWEDLTKGQRESVDASGFWLKTRPRPATRSSPADVTLSVGDTIVPLSTDESEAA